MTEVPTFKVVLLGDLGVGKTCIRSQFVHHIFTNAYKATIGGDYLTTSVTVKHSPADSELDQKVNLQIWDTAGQERFNSISQAFYRGTDIVVLVYDITNYESVLSLRNWFKRFMDHCHVSRPGVIIVGNKTDRSNDRCVDLEEIPEIITNNTDVSVAAYMENWDTDVIETCCKQLESVDRLFERVAELGLQIMYNETNNDSNDDNHLKRIIGFDSIDLNGVINRSSNASNCSC